VPEMWEQEGLRSAGPRVRGDVKKELSVPHFTFWGRAELTENVFGPTDQKRQPMEEYKNAKLVVRYDPGVCIHAGECVRGLPSVFNLSKKPWVDVGGASAAAIIEQVKCCPSGALTYELLKRA
jgi:uncharacterized Fe-S cluster protein YjdI